jgi:hypothetical protein
VTHCGLAHEGNARVIPPKREAQTTEAVSDKLKAPKANGIAEGEAIAHQTFTISGDGERKRVNHQNVQRKSMMQIPFLAPQLSVFSALAKYRVVKIVHSSSEVVVRTTKWFDIEHEQVLQAASRELKKFTW